MFYITISNGLLKDDHRKRMGSAVWEFMWCIDKVTRIDEDGTGWVLGGKPIKLSDLAVDMGVSEDTVSRNLSTLEECGYITKITAPYGLVLKVNHAKKRFGKNVEPKTAQMPNLGRKNAEPNKTVSVDKTEDRGLSNKPRPSEAQEVTIVSEDEEGYSPNAGKKSGRGRNAAAERVAAYFNKKAREYTSKPVIGYGYSIAKELIEQKKVSEKFLIELVDEFFESMPPDDKAVNPYVCFSRKNINNKLLS